MQSIYRRISIICLVLLLAGGGPVVGMLRLLVASSGPNPTIYEEEEQRGKEHSIRTHSSIRRETPRERVQIVSAGHQFLMGGLPRRSHISQRYLCPHAATDLRNGIGAPLLC